MNVEIRVLAAVGSWDHEGLAVDGESGVADEAFIEDAVRGLAVVYSTLGFAGHTRPRSGHLRFGHGGMDSGLAPRMVKKKFNI